MLAAGGGEEVRAVTTAIYAIARRRTGRPRRQRACANRDVCDHSGFCGRSAASAVEESLASRTDLSPAGRSRQSPQGVEPPVIKSALSRARPLKDVLTSRVQ